MPPGRRSGGPGRDAGPPRPTAPRAMPKILLSIVGLPSLLRSRTRTRCSEVHATAAAGRALLALWILGRVWTRGQRASHLLQLRTGGHLLGVDRGLDAVEEALQPADELGLRDAQ